MARNGFRPTVVERAQGLRSSGSPVDVRGPAVAIADRMGLMPRLRSAGTAARTLTFRNAHDREDGDGDGVEVTFDRSAPRRFGLVVGADGLHSATRRLAFGPEASFVRHMGVYVATVSLGGAAASDTEILMYNAPGSAVSIHPSRGTALAAFMFRSPAIADFDYKDTAQHRRLLEAAFGGGGWRLPELLSRVRDADDLYFDAVSQVVLPRWSTGRVALLGDAASCVSLFGDGSSLAMAGAATLAESLAASGDISLALRRYEAEHRRLTNPKQRNVAQAAAMLIPSTRAGLIARNAATRLWPLAAAATWTGRKLTHEAA